MDEHTDWINQLIYLQNSDASKYFFLIFLIFLDSPILF